MIRVIAAMMFVLACSVAPVVHAQDDCDEEASEAGECAGEASDGDDVDEAEAYGEDDDTEDSGDEDMADDDDVEAMADDESDDEVAAEDDDADWSDSSEDDEAESPDLDAAGAEEEDSDDDGDAEIATDDDDGDADAASGDDSLPADANATRAPASGRSVPASQEPAPARPGASNKAVVIKLPTTGLQFEVPAGWMPRANAGTVIAELPGGRTTVRFEPTEHASLERHREAWARGLGPQLTDLKVEADAETVSVNGLQQVHSAGAAMLGGKPLQWHLTIVKGGKTVLLVMALGEDTGAVEKVYASIRRMGRNSAASTNDDPPIIPDYDPGN